MIMSTEYAVSMLIMLAAVCMVALTTALVYYLVISADTKKRTGKAIKKLFSDYSELAGNLVETFSSLICILNLSMN